jgi:purine-binding chemotaxis protein CheW
MRQRKRFDWEAIHAELDRRLGHFGQTIEDDAARVRELLVARSRSLAAVARDRLGEGGLTRLLVFRLGQERYGLTLDCAREVASLSRAATIPGAGPGLIGVVNWRGEFAVVFDLAPILGRPAGEDRNGRQAIVLSGGEQIFALAVDAVEEVVRVDLEALQPPEQLRPARVELFRGATTTDGVMVLAEDALKARLTEELQAA